MKYFGAIETGGTKTLCAIGNVHGEWLAQDTFPTTSPEDTLDHCIRFFAKHRSQWPISSAGLASFGPLDLDPASEYYGHITTTPKAGWRDYNVLGQLRQDLRLPIRMDTDVNAAALAEQRWGAGRGCDPVVYITVGTGVGGGLMANGHAVHGLVHPEMGHMRTPRLEDDFFPGICPFHGDCIEGLCSGPAIAARAGQPAENLTPDDPVWQFTAHYLALFASNLILTLSPQRLIFGGGVMQHSQLLDLIRRDVQRQLNNYLRHQHLQLDPGQLIVTPELAGQSGLCGALALAMDELDQT